MWCIARLGARQLFYGPANQVLSPAIATRWIEALLPACPKVAKTLWFPLARKTGDPVRDVAPAIFCCGPAKITDPHLAAQLDGDTERDERALGRIFGEALPSGLILEPTVAD